MKDKKEFQKRRTSVGFVFWRILLICLILNLNFFSISFSISNNTGEILFLDQDNEEPIEIDWLEPELVSESDDIIWSKAQVALDSKNNLHVVWDQDHLYYRVFKKRTNTWSEIKSLNDSRWVSNPKIAIDKHDRVHVSWLDSWTLKYRYKNFNGWSSVQTAVTKESYSSTFAYEIAVDDNLNRIHFVWDDYNNTEMRELFTRFYDKKTKDWSTITQITESINRSKVINSFKVDSKSRLHMVWEKSLLWPDKEIFYQLLDENYNELIAERMISENDGIRSEDPKLVLDSNDNPHIVWKNNNDYVSSNICYRSMIDFEWQNIVNLTHDEQVLNPDIYSDDLNTIHLVWLEYNSSNYSYFSYKQFIGQNRWSITQKLPYDIADLNPKLAVESNGNVHIVFDFDDDEEDDNNYTRGLYHLFGKSNKSYHPNINIIAVSVPFGLFLLLVIVVIITFRKITNS